MACSHPRILQRPSPSSHSSRILLVLSQSPCFDLHCFDLQQAATLTCLHEHVLQSTVQHASVLQCLVLFQRLALGARRVSILVLLSCINTPVLYQHPCFLILYQYTSACFVLRFARQIHTSTHFSNTALHVFFSLSPHLTASVQVFRTIADFILFQTPPSRCPGFGVSSLVGRLFGAG